jgi:hypothetical protein
VKDNHLRLEVSDSRSIEIGGLIHGSHLNKPKDISIMKVQGMLGRSSESQDGGKPGNGNRILCTICHPSNAGAVFVEEGGLKLRITSSFQSY